MPVIKARQIFEQSSTWVLDTHSVQAVGNQKLINISIPDMCRIRKESIKLLKLNHLHKNRKSKSYICLMSFIGREIFML